MKRFGRYVLQTLIGFTALTLLSSCNREPDTNNVSGDVKVRIPFPNDGGGYSLQDIQLSGINSMYEFSGKYANFYVYPKISGNKITGFRPKAQFIKSGDVFIPKDSAVTQQMVVAYAHIQRLAQLDQDLGVGQLNAGPRDVGLLVRNSSEDGGREVNNAYYHPDTDSILFVPYTAEDLPVGINGGVLAHEHFHSLFFKLVGRNSEEKDANPSHGINLLDGVLEASSEKARTTFTERKSDSRPTLSLSKKTNLFFLLGLNEGLADFWALIYTGDTDFVSLSLPGENARRTMKVEAKNLPRLRMSPVKTWRDIIDTQARCDGAQNCCNSIYCLGTEFSRVFTAFSALVEKSRGLNPSDARRVVAKAILKSLPLLAIKQRSLKEDEYLEPVKFLGLVEAAMPAIKPEESQFLKGIRARTLEQTEAAPTAVPPMALGGFR